MCGRFAYFGKGFFGYESLHYPKPPPFESYSSAPSQNILVLLRDPESKNLKWSQLRWGLVPFWSKEKQTKFNLINARAEGIESKPSFRGPSKYRRCIIPASGFYEWQKRGEGKQPFFIHPADGGYLAFAGIWDHWEGKNGEIIESCSIITTNANSTMANIHDRMPVILQEKDCLVRLDNSARKEHLQKLLRPCLNDLIDAYPVSTLVNNARNNDRGCVARIALSPPSTMVLGKFTHK
ncbi:MAG: SOS response-associated peptidase [Desulfobulbus sp.]|nr:SOS response-associated peptidase [Desulfobulbus sp.]